MDLCFCVALFMRVNASFRIHGKKQHNTRHPQTQQTQYTFLSSCRCRPVGRKQLLSKKSVLLNGLSERGYAPSTESSFIVILDAFC
ncbi:hypothetical protein F5H01DRAFT_333072 [Linnemannia elongata]|nr:hypothetical protein F5H01DRAFT_333072 [Linnemannia elongata]